MQREAEALAHAQDLFFQEAFDEHLGTPRQEPKEDRSKDGEEVPVESQEHSARRVSTHGPQAQKGTATHKPPSFSQRPPPTLSCSALPHAA